MGLLADIYSAGDGMKRKVKGLLADPLGTIEQKINQFGEDQQAAINNAQDATGFNGNRSVLMSSQQKQQASKALGDYAGSMGLAGTINTKQLAEMFPSVDFSLLQKGNQATLSKIVVPKADRGQGTGTQFMNALVKAADEDGTQLALSPSGDFGGSKSRLVDFYKQFGFVPNKGRNIDFSISESMRREAK